MPSDGGGEVFSFFVEKLDLGDAAAAAPGVGGDGEIEQQTKANWMRGHGQENAVVDGFGIEREIHRECVNSTEKLRQNLDCRG